MKNLTVENVYIRHNAKLLTNKHFGKLLGMTLIIAAVVFGLIAAGMALLVLMSDSSNAAIIMIGYFLLMLLFILLSSGLGLGYTQALLGLCRGKKVSVKQVFSPGIGRSFKAFRLSLWVGLKIFLWILPLYAIIGFVGFGIAVAGDPNAAELTNATAQVTLMVLPLVALVGVAALVIPAALRYMLSTYVLADKPETGVRACVHESKAMMTGHKWQAFKLTIPLLLAMYAISFGVTLLFSLLATFLGNSEAAVILTGTVVPLISIALSVYFSIRMTVCQTMFYLHRTGEQTTPESAE